MKELTLKVDLLKEDQEQDQKENGNFYEKYTIEMKNRNINW